MLAGQDAAFAATAALYARRESGKGRLIDISLVNSMTRFLSCRIVPYLGSGEAARRSGGRDSVIAIYQTFDTRDAPMTLALGTDTIWKRFWETVAGGIPPQFEKYDTNARRHAARPEIVEAIQEVLLHKTRDEWLHLFAQARVPAGPINRIDEVAADEHLQEQMLFYGLLSGSRIVPQVGTGFMLDGRPNVPRSAPPQLGEHTSEILGNLVGCTAAEIEKLKTVGVI
jgi:crotonobetainyl-CoA:carnitine CoA-transferase CaiB-like acyl-CoA transferase